MKKRKGFISNSSSSSFVCDVCGEVEAGFDFGLEDVYMFECENGHVLHTKCSNNFNEIPSEEFDNDNELRYNVPEKYCPICLFEIYSEIDMKCFLKKKYNITEEEVFEYIKSLNKRRKKIYDNEYNIYVAKKMNIQIEDEFNEIKNKFKTYKDFMRYLK